MRTIIKLLVFFLLSLKCKSFHYNYKPTVDPNKFITPKADYTVKNVHIVFMNHLDVGYNGIPKNPGLIVNVLNEYFTVYYPRAIKVHADLKKYGFSETFSYTTHPWLVDLYLNCPPNLVMSGIKLQCPSKTEIDAFENAVKSGVIHWHAGAMNMYYEVMDPLVMRMSLNISNRLDALFQIEKPMRVISQRDVPGLTISIVPYLVENGIYGITHGINPSSSSPKFPLISRWQFQGKEVLYVQDPGGYPNNPGPYPANPGGIGTKLCRWLPGMTDALCFAFRGDNSGPPETYQEVLSNYEIVRAQFPNAKLFASTYENFFTVLWRYRSLIPVITNEMGDTWVQGASSDPRKQAEFKAVVRALNQCNQKKLCDFSDSRLINSSRFLVKLAEHTYGLNTAGDFTNWSNDQFAKIRNNPNIKLAEKSWLEQRNITYLAVDALGDHPVRADVEKEMAKLRVTPMKYKRSNKRPLDVTQRCSGSMPTYINIAPDGSINYLLWNQKALVTSPGKIGQILYRTYNETDTAFFDKYYAYGPNLNPGFGKSGSTKAAHPESRWWPLSVTEIHKRPNETCTIDVRVVNKLPQPEVWYGGAAEYWITYTFQPDYSLSVTLQWFNKTTTRLMESIFMGFSPDGVSTDWVVSKIGLEVSPYSVAQNGSQWQHGLDDGGVTATTPRYKMNVQTLDSLVASPWTPSYGPTVWSAPLSPIPRTPGIKGMAFSLYNNIWNTNFIFWYPYIAEDANFKARFLVKWMPDKEDDSLRFYPLRS